STEFAMRLPGLAFGLLLVPLMAEWGRLVAGRRVGALAGLFTAVSQTLIWLSQEVHNQYDVALSFTVLANILIIHACKREKSRWLWLAYALAVALTAHGHYFGIFTVITHAVYVWLQPQRWAKLREWLAATAVAGLLFLPWPLITLSALASEHLVANLRAALVPYLLDVGNSLTVGAPFAWPLARWLLLVALALLGRGWFWLKQQQPAWAWALAAWMGSATWALFLLRFRREIFNDYYLAIIAPGWWLLIAVGIVALWQQRRTWLALGGVTLLLGANLLSIGNYYGKPEDYQRYLGYRSIAEEIASAAQPGDLLLLHAPDPAFEYYLRDITLPRTRQPEDFGITDSAIEEELANLASKYGRIWFIPAKNNAVDPTDVVPRWLDYHLLHELDVPLQKLQLQAFRTQAGLPDVLRPLNRSLDDWLTLEGYFWLINGRPASTNLTLAPNDNLTVTLVWQANQSPPADWTVFVHLIGADGQLVAQQDNAPLFGTRPTRSWQPGEQLIDRYELIVPADTPAQTAQLLVGMYDPVTGERQAFGGEETAVSLGMVEIRR
ncbi:MAG: glycosyltransferase family 39 protein, partial [Anaerolineales bacterium]|nr:glycosyltransferase family 39 protein [Anaerolineales bacterium]